MVEVMRRARGVGLAAPQIGVSRRVIAVEVDDCMVVMANPQVEEASGSQKDWEGCLSVPGYLGLVERPARVRVAGLDQLGRKVWAEGEDLMARALLHEIDHLDGILFTDRAERVIELPPAASLRIVFMGTPEFASLHLFHLLKTGCTIAGVVTQPDRPSGRGYKVRPTPVKELARDRNIPVLAPDRVDAMISEIMDLEPDVIVTCAYGQILPPSILEIPPLGCVNVHASLLPLYRGAAPIQRAIMDGQTKTGVTIMQMDEGMDTGPILLQEEIDIGPTDDFEQVHDRLIHLGSRLLVEALNGLARGELCPRPQEGTPSMAPSLRTGDLMIDWSLPAKSIHNRIRALSPAPGARTTWGPDSVRVLQSCPAPAATEPALPGTVLGTEGDFLVVAAGPTGLERLMILEIWPAGRNRMTGSGFWNGYRNRGTILGRRDDT